MAFTIPWYFIRSAAHLAVTRKKCPSTTTDIFGRCWRPPFYHDFRRFRRRLNFFLVSEALYCHILGQIMVDDRPARGRCQFFDFASDFGLWPIFSGYGAVMSVSLADLFFRSHDLAHVARCNSLWSGPWVPEVSISVRLSVPHHCWLLAFIFGISIFVPSVLSCTQFSPAP
jgi:hypothetical protein